jgi:hypothetical protein
MNDTIVKEFDNMLYSMAGVINVRTYFSELPCPIQLSYISSLTKEHLMLTH